MKYKSTPNGFHVQRDDGAILSFVFDIEFITCFCCMAWLGDKLTEEFYPDSVELTIEKFRTLSWDEFYNWSTWHNDNA